MLNLSPRSDLWRGLNSPSCQIKSSQSEMNSGSTQTKFTQQRCTLTTTETLEHADHGQNMNNADTQEFDDWREFSHLIIETLISAGNNCIEFFSYSNVRISVDNVLQMYYLFFAIQA